MSDYISRDELARKATHYEINGYKTAKVVLLKDVLESPAADVVEVQSVIERMNEERKRAKGNWGTDPYWRGWVDAMRRAQRIVDGTIDDEPVYATSYATCNEDKREAEK